MQLGYHARIERNLDHREKMRRKGRGNQNRLRGSGAAPLPVRHRPWEPAGRVPRRLRPGARKQEISLRATRLELRRMMTDAAAKAAYGARSSGASL